MVLIKNIKKQFEGIRINFCITDVKDGLSIGRFNQL